VALSQDRVCDAGQAGTSATTSPRAFPNCSGSTRHRVVDDAMPVSPADDDRRGELIDSLWRRGQDGEVVVVGQDILIEEPPESVWLVISDVERTGDWSPECRRCRWLDGADRPVVGGRYRGSSRNGWRRWSTTSTITTAIPGVELQWDVTYFRRPVARWRFHLTALSGGGTRLEESVEDRREWWLRIVSPWVTGSRHRDVRNASTIGTSLTRIKAIAEAQQDSSSAD
jgi:hypothetical protein